MMIRSITSGVVATALMTSVAFAQTPSTTTTTDRASSSTMASDASSHKGEWRTSKLIGLNVYNDNNEKLGDINELLVDQNGKIQAAVIGVGGFLGIGENDVAVSFDKLKFVNEPVAYAAGSGANTGGARPAGSASTGAPMTTTGTSTPSGAATTPAPMTTTGTGTGTGAAGTSSGMTGSGNMGSASNSGAAASRSNPWYPDHATLSATKDQLKSMTQFKYSN